MYLTDITEMKATVHNRASVHNRAATVRERGSSVHIERPVSPWRRLFDTISAAAGLLVLLPVFELIAIAILLDDGRPVFFTQVRVGRGGQPFRIWKFRTMRPGAAGNAITAAGDNRVTRLGRLLRKCKLD